MNRQHLSSKWTRLHVADRNQLGQFVSSVDTAICDFHLPFPGLPVARPPRLGVVVQVSNNDFSQGRSWLVVGTGPFVLVAGVDFKIGKSAGQTAAALAAALGLLGLGATAAGATVQVVAPANDDPFPVKAWSSGPVANFQVQPLGGVPLPGPWDPPLRVV